MIGWWRPTRELWPMIVIREHWSMKGRRVWFVEFHYFLHSEQVRVVGGWRSLGFHSLSFLISIREEKVGWLWLVISEIFQRKKFVYTRKNSYLMNMKLRESDGMVEFKFSGRSPTPHSASLLKNWQVPLTSSPDVMQYHFSLTRSAMKPIHLLTCIS